MSQKEGEASQAAQENNINSYYIERKRWKLIDRQSHAIISTGLFVCVRYKFSFLPSRLSANDRISNIASICFRVETRKKFDRLEMILQMANNKWHRWNILRHNFANAISLKNAQLPTHPTHRNRELRATLIAFGISDKQA